MAVELVLNAVPAEPLGAQGIVLDGRVEEFQEGSIKLWYWRWDNDPTMQWQFLGESAVGSQLSVPFPFDVTTRRVRVGYVLRTNRGVDNVIDLRNMVQSVYPNAPTFTSATFDLVNFDVDLVFFKNGSATGNIQVEYKKVVDLLWLTHATTFAHSVTSGSIIITRETTNQLWALRLKQVGLEGFYSQTIEVTVTGTGGGGGSPPSSLVSTAVEQNPCEWDVTSTWTNGTGSGTHLIERKWGAGSWTILVDPATSGHVDSVYGPGGSSVIVKYRVKQSDVVGYSNERSVTIARCIS